MKCSILISFLTLYLEIIFCDEFNIVRLNTKIPKFSNDVQSSYLICLTDSINDAIVWNTNIIWNKIVNYTLRDQEFSQKKPELIHPRSSHNCKFSFNLEQSDWKLTWNTEVPMGPVFDSRWERFEEYNTIKQASLDYQPVTITKDEGKSNLIFGTNGAIVVSIRGEANAQFLICTNQDYHKNLCYWIIIGGWKNSQSVIRKCQRGVSFSPVDFECAKAQSKLMHAPLSRHEWKTFVITWNGLTKTIKLYDPHMEFLSYSDTDSKLDNGFLYHVFFGNSLTEFPLRFRFHEYTYQLTTKPETQYNSHNCKMDATSNGRICIDMIVGLCASCKLHVRLIDPTDNKELTKSIISGSTTSQIVQHGLPIWQRKRIIAPNINDTREYTMIKITTKSTNEQGLKHWAIGDIHQCSDERTVKGLYMEPIQDINGEMNFQRDVTCQRLSYDQQHAQVISSNMNITNPPENVISCRENYIGPKCNIPCDLYTDKFCKGAAICDKNQCYCPQGYTSNDCSEDCSEKNGEFGHNCREKCDNCHNQKCSIYTGECRGGCKKLDGEYRYVPPFCKYTVKFPKLLFEKIDLWNLKIYFPKVNYNKELNITYEFELQENDSRHRKQNAETGVNTKMGPIYFTIFNKLIPGVEYKARILQHIQYKELDWIEEIRLDGDYSKQLTMCSWSENFTIELDDQTLTINRIDHEDVFSCPDEYYSVKVVSTTSKMQESQTIDVTNVKGKFPMIVRNLTPNTNYLISITGLSPSYYYHKEVRTFPIKSLPIRESRIDSVTSTEVSFSWLPSEGTNDTIDGYSVSIKALRYESCDNHISMDSIKTQLHEIANTSKSYTIRDLIPYVHYKLIILAHRANKDTKSIITFTTPAKVIPTAVFQNLTFNNGIIRWNKTVANCSTVTGPINATRLFFFGVSENVKNFTDQYDTMMDTFTLHETKQQDIHSCEQYRVRIHSLREINGTHNDSAYNELIFTADPRSPRPPGKIFTTKIEQGIVDLNWEYPPKTVGLMKDFIIHYQLMLTKLKRELQVVDFNNFIFYPITSHQNLYTTQLKLLPSTNYKIDIIGVVECGEYTLVGNSSSIEIITPSSFAWYKNEPSYIVNNNNFSITVHLPRINHETVNSKIHIFLIGEASCGELFKLNESLASDIELKDGEKAYHIDLFTTPPPRILIGGYGNNNNNTNCELFSESSYVIVIVIRDDIDDSKPFVWRSRSIKFVPRNRYEIWAVPLLILIIIIGLIIIIWYFKRTKKRQLKIKNNRGGNKAWRCSQRDLNLEPINEERYIERTPETLVKLDKFRDYVKCAIASGKLEMQYSRLSSSRVKSSDDGLLSQQGSGDTDYITVANETAVILKGHPGDPNFECLNAHYMSGYKKLRAYIILEGPESSAVINFWRMIWQEQIEIICMLSDIVDDEQIKCEQYWPELGKSMKFGNITVDNINHAPFADYTFRVFVVKCDEEIRTINHLHYTAWPDYGIPLYTQSVVTYLKKLFAIPSNAGPVLVHCEAGVGRTGMIVLLDICHRRAIAESVLDIFGMTEEIKRQRKNMVDNKQQYIFAHVALVECLLSQSTAIICNELLRMKIQERKYQLTLEQERLEQSVLQDKALQFSTRSKLKLSEKNIAKNRFPATLPPTRLYIPRYPLSDDDSSYISGVYVDSARRRNSYIASQIPLPTTVTDFWRMIAEFNVELIIILQRPDLQDPTCCNFIPEPDEEMEALPFFNIIGKSVTDGEHFSQQKIILVNESQGTPTEQSIVVLTCEGWKSGRDKRPPMPTTLVKLWQMAERISRSDEPTVVLCHDGVTGCGLYLALSLLLERMGLELECDVCFAIRAIRRSRFNFCTSKEQFKYLYNAASLYAAHFDAYSNFK